MYSPETTVPSTLTTLSWSLSTSVSLFKTFPTAATDTSYIPSSPAVPSSTALLPEAASVKTAISRISNQPPSKDPTGAASNQSYAKKTTVPPPTSTLNIAVFPLSSAYKFNAPAGSEFVSIVYVPSLSGNVLEAPSY